MKLQLHIQKWIFVCHSQLNIYSYDKLLSKIVNFSSSFSAAYRQARIYREAIAGDCDFPFRNECKMKIYFYLLSFSQHLAKILIELDFEIMRIEVHRSQIKSEKNCVTHFHCIFLFIENKNLNSNNFSNVWHTKQIFFL